MITIGPIKKLGTIWWFEFFDLQEIDPQVLETRLVDCISQFENDYSRFDDDSLLSQLNRNHTMDLSNQREMKDMLNIAREAYRDTQGVFNIAVGDYLEKTGYDQDYSFTSQAVQDIPDLEEVLSLDQDKVEIQSGVRIDFGGFGKGYLIDRVAQLLRTEFGLEYFLINGGGDMYATSNHGEPIVIGLQDPRTGDMIGSLPIFNQGFASSSPYLRRWKDQDGIEHDHLVAGHNREKKITYITAPSAVMADIWATSLSLNSQLKTPLDVKAHIL